MVPQLFVPPARGSSTFLAAYKAQLIPKSLQVNFVDLETKQVLSGPRKGEDFRSINPRGNCPALLFSDGELLHESGAIMEWIADRNTDTGLAPIPGTSARYELICKLNYINSELQTCCEPLMKGEDLDPAIKSYFLEKLKAGLQYVSDQMLPAGSLYLHGNKFTVADAKLYFILGWLDRCGVDLTSFHLLKKYWDHLGSLPFVQEAVSALEEQIAGVKE